MTPGHTDRSEHMKTTKTTTTAKTTTRRAAKPVCQHCGRDNGRPAAPDCRNLQACASRLMNAAA